MLENRITFDGSKMTSKEELDNARKLIGNCFRTQEDAELSNDNRLAKQFIDKTLQFFNLTQYDWLADQNEITTEIEDYVNKLKTENEELKKALDEIEQYCIDTLDLQDVHTIKQDILRYIKTAKGEEQ